jgi:hypothetical protein
MPFFRIRMIPQINSNPQRGHTSHIDGSPGFWNPSGVHMASIPRQWGMAQLSLMRWGAETRQRQKTKQNNPWKTRNVGSAGAQLNSHLQYRLSSHGQRHYACKRWGSNAKAFMCCIRASGIPRLFSSFFFLFCWDPLECQSCIRSWQRESILLFRCLPPLMHKVKLGVSTMGLIGLIQSLRCPLPPFSQWNGHMFMQSYFPR